MTRRTPKDHPTLTNTVQPGEQLNKRHGLLSTHPPALLGETRQEIFDALAEAAPVRSSDGSLPAADAALVELAARSLARVREADEWVMEHGALDRKGKPRPAIAHLEKATRNAAELLDRLGLGPRARAALGVDLQRGFDLAKHWEGSDDAA